MNVQQTGWVIVSSLIVSVAGGWLNGAIAAPQAGSTSVELAQAKTVCRRILPTPTMIQEGGVVLRQGPSRTSPRAGVGYAPRERFQTTLETATDNEARIWLRVASPRAGWISAGRNKQITNIGYCL